MAVAQGTWTGSSSPDDLRYRLDILDAELADIRSRLGGGGSSAQSTGGGGASDARVNALEGELRRLIATVEQMQNTQRQLSQQIANRLGDVEFRLTELEGGDPNDVAPVELPGTGNLLGGGASVESSTTGGGQQLALSVSEQGDFDRAVRDVQQGRFDQAEDRLRDFIGSYPSSPLQANAFLWLGESQFARGIYADAASNYLKAYNVDRGGPVAPESLYKVGVSLGRLGQINEACLTLREVRVQFPNSAADIVNRADAEADNLTCG
jgi:tol-pal system protein YbgF